MNAMNAVPAAAAGTSARAEGRVSAREVIPREERTPVDELVADRMNWVRRRRYVGLGGR